MSGITYSGEAAQALVSIYSTPDVVAQREVTLQRLALKPGERVIDVGSGPGFLCESMAAAVGATGQVLGIELSKPTQSSTRSMMQIPTAMDLQD